MKLFIQRTQLGFSLTELLVVVALMGFLAAASVPALSALNGSGRVNQTVSEIAGFMEQARQYAIAQNTYVWVAFYEDPNAAGGNSITVAVMASNNGTDPTATNSKYAFGIIPRPANSNPPPDVTLISPIRVFSQIKLQDAGTLSFTKLPTLALSDGTNGLAKDAATFMIKPPGSSNSTPVQFSRYIQFTPSGEAHNYATTIDVLEIGMQPRKGSSAPVAGSQEKNNVAVLRINGLTGLTQVYRP